VTLEAVGMVFVVVLGTGLVTVPLLIIYWLARQHNRQYWEAERERARIHAEAMTKAFLRHQADPDTD
jgi:lipopolysaccharide export system protein LptC